MASYEICAQAGGEDNGRSGLIMCRTVIGVLLPLLLWSGLLQADQLLMANGDRLSGKVVSKSGDWLLFETGYAGKLRIRWHDVRELTTDQPVTVLLEDEELTKASRFAPQAGTDVVELADVSHINPPPELSGEGIAFDGRIDIGLDSTSGNTDTQTYHLETEAVVRTRGYRVTLTGLYDEASDSGVKSIKKASAGAKYDRFLSEHWYVYGHTKFKHDRFKDLKLRSEVGLGAGHQFIETAERKLALEAGLTQVDDDYYLATDESLLSARWAANFETLFYRDLLTLFHNHELTVPLEDSNDYVLSARTGVRIPVANHLDTTIGVDVDYDNEPSAGNDKTDLHYLFTLGYKW